MRDALENFAKRLAGRKTTKISLAVLGLFVLGGAFWQWGYPAAFEAYTGVVNAPLTYETSTRHSDREFEALAREVTGAARMERARAVTADEEDAFARRVKVNMLLKTPSFLRESDYPHIKYFREAGVRRYEGPSTCLRCHETMHVSDGNGTLKEVDTLDDVLSTVHYKFQSTDQGFSTYGYDGREVNGEGTRAIPVGKIDRACGIPGSFSWTGWAQLVETKPEHGHGEVELRSEGCGQCHIGGGYHPATELMMPVGDVPDEIKEGVDCLICHAKGYDMNQRYVIEDEHGLRWNQDRSLKTAMTVGLPTTDNCLLCHQHNLGGDLEDVPQANAANKNLGYKAKRLLHPGAKRASSFTPATDVHAKAGIGCTDCHVPEGHRVPRGVKGVDLVANDLPDKVVECENCHTSAPHLKADDRVILNGHVARLACETCHITHLREDNVVLRDWVHPIWDEEEGVYLFTDVLHSGQAGQGFTFLWFNGNGTFLANALGDNPLGGTDYNPLMNQLTRIDNPEAVAEIRRNALRIKEHYPDLDVNAYVKAATNSLAPLSPEMLEKRARMIEQNLRPVMAKGKSRIYPFKVFNALMWEDMANQGPFGAMILPFDYPTYYQTGDTLASVQTAVANPIVKRMYEAPFKAYMMDEFMSYFGVDEWRMEYPIANGALRNVEAHWMRQMGTLMINHGVTNKGRECKDCHDAKGVMDFEALGYPPERVADLTDLRELKEREKAKAKDKDKQM